MSDGLNTAFADVEELTPEAAIYPVPEPGFGLGLFGAAAMLGMIGRRARERARR